MPTDGINEKLIALTTDLVSVESGQMILSFTGNNFSYGSEELTVRVSLPTGDYSEVIGTFVSTGRFTAGGGEINFRDVVSETEIHSFRLVRNGQVMEGTTDFAPVIQLEPPESAGYQCLGNSLTLQYDAVGVRISEEFQRQP